MVVGVPDAPPLEFELPYALPGNDSPAGREDSEEAVVHTTLAPP